MYSNLREQSDSTLKSERANVVANHPQPAVPYYAPSTIATSKTKDAINAILADGDDESYMMESTADYERISAIAANSAQSDTDSDEVPELVSDSEDTITAFSDSESEDDTPIPETARPRSCEETLRILR